MNSKKPFENTDELLKYNENSVKSVYFGKKGKVEDHKKKEPKTNQDDKPKIEETP